MVDLVDALVHFTPIRLCMVLEELQKTVFDLWLLMRPLLHALVVDLVSEEGHLLGSVTWHLVMFSSINW